MRIAPVLLSVALAWALFAPDAFAQEACAPGSFTSATSTFQVDANHNGAWNGDAGGDRTTQIGAYLGPGEPIVGDWNGDGFDDAGVYVGNVFVLDLDGDGVWEGNAGGDRAASFAASYGAGTAIVGDWNGDGRDEIGVFLPLEARFLLDANGNGVWDGTSGGDQNAVIAGWVAGTSDPLVADWNGDGRDDIGRRLDIRLFLDRNGTHAWEGSSGGDGATNGFQPLYPHFDEAQSFVRRFGGAPRIGLFFPRYSGIEADLNGNGIWNGTAGGDLVANYASFSGVGVPLVCDWNGDGADEFAKVVAGTRYQVDLDGDFRWVGPAGGDLALSFDVGAPATPSPAGGSRRECANASRRVRAVGRKRVQRARGSALQGRALRHTGV